MMIAPPSGEITAGFTISPTSSTATPTAKLIGQIVAALAADCSCVPVFSVNDMRLSSSSAWQSRETRRRTNRGARPSVADNFRLSGARSSPLPVESREPNGYAGKEAIKAPSGVVMNAAKIHVSKSGPPWAATDGTVAPRPSRRSYDKPNTPGPRNREKSIALYPRTDKPIGLKPCPPSLSAL
jgi:hypothetical protein